MLLILFIIHSHVLTFQLGALQQNRAFTSNGDAASTSINQLDQIRAILKHQMGNIALFEEETGTRVFILKVAMLDQTLNENLAIINFRQTRRSRAQSEGARRHDGRLVLMSRWHLFYLYMLVLLFCFVSYVSR